MSVVGESMAASAVSASSASFQPIDITCLAAGACGGVVHYQAEVAWFPQRRAGESDASPAADYQPSRSATGCRGCPVGVLMPHSSQQTAAKP